MYIICGVYETASGDCGVFKEGKDDENILQEANVEDHIIALIFLVNKKKELLLHLCPGTNFIVIGIAQALIPSFYNSEGGNRLTGMLVFGLGSRGWLRGEGVAEEEAIFCEKEGEDDFIVETFEFPYFFCFCNFAKSMACVRLMGSKARTSRLMYVLTPK